MSLLQALVLGLVQGVSEFFPISSSGHLIILPRIFGWQDQGLAFDVILHLGTLCALFWHFRDMISTIIRRASKTGPEQKDARRLVLQLGIATIPALFFGYLLRDLETSSTRHASIVAGNLAFWGIILFLADRYSHHVRKSVERVEKELSWKQALAVGCAQVLALAPGTSRSGITMTTGLFMGLSRAAAARFSFLLSIPITAAAGAHGLLTLVRHPDQIHASGLALAVGFLASLLSGAWAIRFLLSYVAKQSYDIFVAYRVLLALTLVYFF